MALVQEASATLDSFAKFEEGLRVAILGSKRRGQPTENRFDHTTGSGFYKGHTGH